MKSAKIDTNNTEPLLEEDDSEEERISDWRARENYKQKKDFKLKMKNKRKNVSLLLHKWN